MAVGASTSPGAVFNVGVRLRGRVDATVVDREALAKAIDEAYGEHAERSSLEALIEGEDPAELDEPLSQAERDLLATEGKGPIVRFV